MPIDLMQEYKILKALAASKFEEAKGLEAAADKLRGGMPSVYYIQAGRQDDQIAIAGTKQECLDWLAENYPHMRVEDAVILVNDGGYSRAWGYVLFATPVDENWNEMLRQAKNFGSKSDALSHSDS